VSERDNIYISNKVKHIPFAFNEEVTKVFSDMIDRSVPGYKSSLNLIEVYGKKYCKPGNYIYDLGCSLGAVTEILLSCFSATNKIIAVDNSESMINSCRKRFSTHVRNGAVELIKGDVREIKFKESSFISLNYLMQFLEISERKDLIMKVFNSLGEGGVCVLSEKIHFTSFLKTQRINALHYQFKSENGYSSMEIAQKRDALEGVLVTEIEEEHIKRLLGVGFRRVKKIMSNLNFVTFICEK
jgi:tRNA (cmo5U34)-methyltransferase